MPGIGRLGDPAFIRAFQVIDAIIQESQPLFMLVWLGSIAGLIATLVLGVREMSGLPLVLVPGGGARRCAIDVRAGLEPLEHLHDGFCGRRHPAPADGSGRTSVMGIADECVPTGRCDAAAALSSCLPTRRSSA